MLTLLLAGLGVTCLPKILFAVLIVALFLVILYIIISKVVPAEWRSIANWVVLVLVLIALLIVLIQIYESGLQSLC